MQERVTTASCDDERQGTLVLRTGLNILIYLPPRDHEVPACVASNYDATIATARMVI